jgi:hypothetical protein
MPKELNRIQVFVELQPKPRVQLKFETPAQANAYYKLIAKGPEVKAQGAKVSTHNMYMTLPQAVKKLEGRLSFGGFSFILDNTGVAKE